MKKHIFLSYSRTDVRSMHYLTDQLIRRGFSIWSDENIKLGTPSWTNKLESALHKAICLVVLLSPDAKVSPWVEREFQYAKSLNLRIFPVLVRGRDEDSVPLELMNAQCVDLRGAGRDYELQVDRLSQAIREHWSENRLELFGEHCRSLAKGTIKKLRIVFAFAQRITVCGRLVEKKILHEQNQINAIAVHPNAALGASAGDDGDMSKGTIHVFSLLGNQGVKRLEGHMSSVKSVVFSPDGTMLASSADNSIHLWSCSNWELQAKLESVDFDLSQNYSVAFSPDGQTVASAQVNCNFQRGLLGNIKGITDEKHHVRLWDVRSKCELTYLEGHSDYIQCVAFSPDGQYLASGGMDGTIRVWKMRHQEVSELITVLWPHGGGWVECLAFSPDSHLLASCSSNDNLVRLIRTIDWREDSMLECGYVCESVSFSPNSRFMVVGNAAHLDIWHTALRVKLCGTITSGKLSTFCPDSRHLVAVGIKKEKDADQSRHEVRLWLAH